MNTSRSKRWNGDIDTLKADYLNDVIAQMTTYGDRVQFAFNGKGARPNYQVINSSDKKMAFDGNNHLVHPGPDEFTGANASKVFTIEQIRTFAAGGSARASATGRATRVSRSSSTAARPTGTAASRALEQVTADKYEYFRNNRHLLPAEITKHSDEITQLMLKGRSAEQAFADVLEKHF